MTRGAHEPTAHTRCVPRTGAVRGQARDRRPGRTAGADGRRPPRARASPRRGRSGAREDDGGEDARAGDRRRVPAHPVHPRPRSRGHRRHPGLQPEARRVPGLARAGLREPRPGRRGQPGSREGAERAARGDAGAAGDDRQGDASAARPVPRDGDAEPDRVGGDVPAARGAGRSLHAQGADRLPEPDRGVRDRRAHDRGVRRRPGARSTGISSSRSNARRTRSSSIPRSSSTPSSSPMRRATSAPSGSASWRTTSRTARARVRRST